MDEMAAFVGLSSPLPFLDTAARQSLSSPALTPSATADSKPSLKSTKSNRNNEEVLQSDTGTGALILEKFSLYETKTLTEPTKKFYAIATNQSDSRFRVLKIDRICSTSEDGNENAELGISSDEILYTKSQITELLETLAAGNVGGLGVAEKLFYGIGGFIKFTTTYYMILITARTVVALVGGHYIYHCEAISLVPVASVPLAASGAVPLPTSKGLAGMSKKALAEEEKRLMGIFLAVEMGKNFYFSYTYNLTHTLQHNLTSISPALNSDNLSDPFTSLNDKFLWNRHLLVPAFSQNALDPFEVDNGIAGKERKKNQWMLPLIYGFVDQAKLSVFGRTIYLTLIARRSRHFAGARFLKRGVNSQGYVANDVETEQIVSEALTTPFFMYVCTSDSSQPRNTPLPRYTSFVQVRGSIPLYWNQENVNLSPKPPIELTIVDPYHSAAALHFDDLFGRYGGPITVLNLIKQKERTPRESKLLREFKECIDYLNQFLSTRTDSNGAKSHGKIKYIAWDIAAANKQRDKDVIGILEDIAEESLESTKFFHYGAEPTWYAYNEDRDATPYRSTPLLQSGVTRTNCIDCLDRTNAAQFVIAKAALGHQLHALGVIHHPQLPFDSDAVNLITEMFHDHGDTVALQYGGSHLVNTMETYRKIGAWSSHSRDMIENLKRYYNNSFVDADKQAAIDLFLGVDVNLPPSSPYATSRRSYREPFTLPSPISLFTLIEAEQRLNESIKREGGNYWLSYYRPRLFTEFGRHFAFKVNSTSKYTATTGESMIDRSPFVPRIGSARMTLPIAHPSLGKSGSRRWIPERSTSKTISTRRPITIPIDNLPPPSPTSNPTENLINHLLNPSVEQAEADEYGSYIDQFSHLSLASEDNLSEKDALLYQLQAEIGEFKIDLGSMNIYVEAVARAYA